MLTILIAIAINFVIFFPTVLVTWQNVFKTKRENVKTYERENVKTYERVSVKTCKRISV